MRQSVKVIVDRVGQAWLLDLDDIAAGPPEADIGNLIAHLATRPDTRLASPAAGLSHWQRRVIATLPPGARLDPARLAAYRELALARRLLKGRARGDVWAAAQLDEAMR